MKTALKKESPTNYNSTRRRQSDRVPFAPNLAHLNFDFGNPLIQRKLNCPCDGGCPRCVSTIQPKLKIGQPDDKYEQEADRVADQVMRMPDPTIQREPT